MPPIPETQVDLNWFQRHPNWTHGPVAFATLLFILGWTWYGLFKFADGVAFIVLSSIAILVSISTGIWLLISKGRSLWMLVIFALWPPAAAWTAMYLIPVYSFWAYWLFTVTLLAALAINVIIVLLLKNRKYRRVVTNENGKRVERWYKIAKSDSK